jgi:hypothetical protein
MKVELFGMCRHVYIDGGVLNIMGLTELLLHPSEPANFKDAVCFVWRLRFSNAERSLHEIRLLFIDSSGKPFHPPQFYVVDFMMPEKAVSRALNGYAPVADFWFPKFGEYSVRLLLDGEDRASLPLWVLHQRL